jgi:hypothetical protein
MFRKLCAGWLLVLALSPFTAPFGIVDAADVFGAPSDQASVAQLPTRPASSRYDAASLIAPLATKTGYLSLVLTRGTAVLCDVIIPRTEPARIVDLSLSRGVSAAVLRV